MESEIGRHDRKRNGQHQDERGVRRLPVACGMGFARESKRGRTGAWKQRYLPVPTKSREENSRPPFFTLSRNMLLLYRPDAYMQGSTQDVFRDSGGYSPGRMTANLRVSPISIGDDCHRGFVHSPDGWSCIARCSLFEHCSGE